MLLLRLVLEPEFVLVILLLLDFQLTLMIWQEGAEIEIIVSMCLKAERSVMLYVLNYMESTK